MSLRFTWRSAALIAAVGVTLGLILSLLAGRDSPASTAALGYAKLLEPTPVPALARTLPGGISRASALLMVQGIVDHRLVIWPLDGSTAPQEIEQQVNLWPLLPDPSGTRVLYSVGDAVMVLDVPARRSTIVGVLPDGSKITRAQWSPDSRAVAYVSVGEEEDTAWYAQADGARPAEAMRSVPAGLPLDVAWLPGGRPVVIALGVGAVGGLEARYYEYELATHEAVLLPPAPPIVQPWSPWRSPDGSQQLYVVLPWDKTWTSGVCRTGALGLADAEWISITTSGGSPLKQRQTAFELHNVWLDDMTWLRDGRVLMRGLAYEACAPAQSGLYLGRVGEEPEQIVQIASPYATSDAESGDLLQGVTYALSPDQSLLLWTDNDVQAGRGTIRRMSVDGGDVETLFQTNPPEPGAPPYAFQDRAMILALVWLP